MRKKIDLLSKVPASMFGRKMVGLGFRVVGYYVMYSGKSDYEIVAPLYASMNGDSLQYTMAHNLSPDTVARLVASHVGYKQAIGSSAESKKLADTISDIDFGGDIMSSIVSLVLPMLTGGGGGMQTSYRDEFVFEKFSLDDKLIKLSSPGFDPSDEVHIPVEDSAEPLVVSVSLLNKDLLSNPNVTKRLMGLLPGPKASSGRERF